MKNVSLGLQTDIFVLNPLKNGNIVLYKLKNGLGTFLDNSSS